MEGIRRENKKWDGSRLYVPSPMKTEIQAHDLMMVDGRWS